MKKWRTNAYGAGISKTAAPFALVRVGRFTSFKQALQTQQHLMDNGFENVYTVAWDL
ncbi:MAG: hypothetical protein R2861_08640 [Desulfobacterales bacterium]